VIAAGHPVQRPAYARLLVIDADGRATASPRARWLDFLESGDVVVANDAATLPASLAGLHAPSGRPIEARLAAWRSPVGGSNPTFDAIVFGAGDYRTPTEDRPPPPRLETGDALVFGPLGATVMARLEHPRFVRLRFDATAPRFFERLARHGRPVQYAHVMQPLAMWDAWTSIAATPVAFEPPSAGFVIAWRDVASMRARRIGFATITHAGGLSSTGDATLDRRLPLDEWYRLPASTVAAIARARNGGGRVIAVGTTVVRALEHAASRRRGLRQGEGMATQRIDARTRLSTVDAIVTGTHEPGSSHHELLRAFASDAVLAKVAGTLERDAFLTHEFGDSMLVFADARTSAARRPPVTSSDARAQFTQRVASGISATCVRAHGGRAQAA